MRLHLGEALRHLAEPLGQMTGSPGSVAAGRATS